MILFYMRHAEPIYNPDSLTPLGEQQAEALAKRLSLYKIDKIYSSSSNRAIQTAKPTAELLKKEIEILEFANENLAWKEFSIERAGKRRWIFQDPQAKQLFAGESEASSQNAPIDYQKGIDRIYSDTFEFMKGLGYEHIKNTGRYKVLRPNNERVAFFAHQGFGIAFLSVLLQIPYPVIANHFDLCHAGITAIEFKEEGGYAIPKVLILSSDAHLYKEGLLKQK